MAAKRKAGAKPVIERAPLYLPAILAVLLSLPCLGFSFLWDDFTFLTNALSGNLLDWLPHSSDPFYRPISRALYFGIVAPFGSKGALFAHVLNLGYLALGVALFTRLAARLRGRSYALLAGTLFAGMMAIPTLVGWASGSQDLLAIDFVLIAFLARASGRDWIAVIALAAAILSKETALTCIPALILWDRIVDRRPYRLLRQTAMYGSLVIAWALIHPAARVLVSRGLAPGQTGYVGLTDPLTWARFAGQYLTVLANVRVGRFDPTWPQATSVYLLLTIIAAFLLLKSNTIRSWEAVGTGIGSLSGRRVAILGGLLFLPSLAMTSTIINSWAPYYAAFPMLGVALIGALGLERMDQTLRLGVLGIYLALGLWARGSNLDTTHITERSLRPSSDALRKIEAGFRKVAPELPRGTDVLLSVQVRGRSRVYEQLYSYQPLRLWYRDLTLRVLKPIRVQPSDRPTALALVTSDLDVVFLNPVTFEMNSASGKPTDYYSCERALRALAVGLGGAGFPDRGTKILLRLPNPTPELRSAHLRMAAMLQLAAGNTRMADSLIAAAPPLPLEVALTDVGVVLAEEPPGMAYDEYALRAYGIRADDATSLRVLTGWLARFGYPAPTHRLAEKLLTLSPGDPVGLRAKEVADSILADRRKWPAELL